MRYAFLTPFLLVFMLSCPGSTWIAHPIPDKDYHRCVPLKEMPQMIPIPDFKGTWQIVENCKVYPREKTAIAMRVFMNEWEKVFGNSYDVKKTYEDLLITWSKQSTRHSGYSVDGREFKNVYLRGATMGPSLIYIFQSNHEPDRHSRICESALAHELVHTVLWTTNGDHGDPDHLGKIYNGWTPDHSAVIQQTNKALCKLGI